MYLLNAIKPELCKRSVANKCFDPKLKAHMTELEIINFCLTNFASRVSGEELTDWNYCGTPNQSIEGFDQFLVTFYREIIKLTLRTKEILSLYIRIARAQLVIMLDRCTCVGIKYPTTVLYNSSSWIIYESIRNFLNHSPNNDLQMFPTFQNQAFNLFCFVRHISKRFCCFHYNER